MSSQEEERLAERIAAKVLEKLQDKLPKTDVLGRAITSPTR